MPEPVIELLTNAFYVSVRIIQKQLSPRRPAGDDKGVSSRNMSRTSLEGAVKSETLRKLPTFWFRFEKANTIVHAR